MAAHAVDPSAWRPLERQPPAATVRVLEDDGWAHALDAADVLVEWWPCARDAVFERLDGVWCWRVARGRTDGGPGAGDGGRRER